jgi:membrane carboxypeptidase/penicillin-binding protein
MHSVSQTMRLRRHRQTRHQHGVWSKLGLVGALTISLVAIMTSMLMIWYYVDLSRSLPSIALLPAFLDPPNGLLLKPTRIYDRNHQHVLLTLENPSAKDKQYLYIGKEGEAGLAEGSRYLVDATVVALDPGFWDHAGFSISGVTEGTRPTLAQRLVSSLLLDTEPSSPRRNIRERLLASQVTAQYGREKVLEWYLNSAQYGESLYGADSASWVYFGKSAADLTLAEAAMLTAIAEKPSINPLTGSQILAQQQEYIIQKMFVKGLVSGDEALGALKENVQFKAQASMQSSAPAFTATVLEQLGSRIPLERIYRGGFDIVTTLDYGLQQQADCAARVQIARIQGAREEALTTDGNPCEAGGFLPELGSGSATLPGDITAEVVIIDPKTGQILAWVGGDGSGLAASGPTFHPAGTILSPFMYLTAFTRGMSPATLLWDIPPVNAVDITNPILGELASGSSTLYHGPVSVREALVNDYGGAASEVLQQMGVENVFLTEKQFGVLPSDISAQSDTSLDTLYSQSVSLVDSVQAYSVLANQGVMAGESLRPAEAGKDLAGLQSTAILNVQSLEGQVWLDWSTAHVVPVVNQQIAYLTTNVLSDEKARWSLLGHPNSLEIGRPVAAKVTVTDDLAGGWTVGYIPQLTVGVWLGNSTGAVSSIGGEMPAGLWNAIMRYASTAMPVQDFSLPSGVRLVQVCDPSGLLITPLCPAITQEVFLDGNEPTQVDNLYRKVSINRETGLLATVFTPSEMVTEKVFLDVPPQAETWAKEAGLAIPPDTYDSITVPQTALQDVQITGPHMFDHVGGEIVFTGSAGGNGFSYFRLQVGQGLNPDKWLQIGGDVNTPVNDGILGTWDTSGLEGMYIVQLQVVRMDRRVDQSILQLTIDNSKPVVKIISPLSDQQYDYHPGMSIMMKVAATDNLVLERVEFFIDNVAESKLLEPPYVIVWDALPGKHTLVVKAYDLAGNVSESSQTFIVSR